MQIEVSLEVFKALTARLSYDGQTYSDVIQELLAEESILDEMGPEESAEDALPMDYRAYRKQATLGGFASRKLWLPDGTVLKARYKQKEYRARINNNAWLDEAGNPHPSPSAAARAITGTNVNGLRFWHALRPNDRTWCRLEALSIS